MDTIRWFRDRAKHLHRSPDAEAQARIAAVLGKCDGVTLQNVQHVVAVEAGFGEWEGVLDASEVERLLVVTMAKEPQLNDFGIGIYGEHRKKPHTEQLAIIDADRRTLRESVVDVAWTVQWLRANIAPTKTINHRRTSYGLKHVAEKYSPKKYLTNGVFIAAAIIAEYPYRLLPDSPNVTFGMSEKSINAIAKRRPSRATAYRCPLCGFYYYDHGPMDASMQHRRVMAAFRVATWEEAEQLIAKRERTVSDDPSWVDQECGDRSAQSGDSSCSGRLVRA